MKHSNQRIRACLKELRQRKLDGMLISSSWNVTWLTGFRPAEGFLLVEREGRLVYVTSPLYAQEARACSLWETVCHPRGIFSGTATAIQHNGTYRLGYETTHLSCQEFQRLTRILGNEVNWQPQIHLLETLRMRKSKSEISAIRKAAEITEEAVRYADDIRADMKSEKELQIEIERFLRLKGDNSPAFPVIVASGRRSAFPHHLSSDEILEHPLLIDLGARFGGYCADLTRNFFSDKMPRSWRKIYDIVRGAQEKAFRSIRPGIAASEVDRRAREWIEKKGYGKYFNHGTGHGVGLEVHEPPALSPRGQDLLEEGMVITLEPGIYLPGRFGIRIEDMVVVRGRKGEYLSGNINRRNSTGNRDRA
ncbi:MAG: M24 family metallopeptidase [Candidatus Omnitrophica bacterium]|nr:M24 family metallopeptidase [Candidatus Omnitrophota bacterium]